MKKVITLSVLLFVLNNLFVPPVSAENSWTRGGGFVFYDIFGRRNLSESNYVLTIGNQVVVFNVPTGEKIFEFQKKDNANISQSVTSANDNLLCVLGKGVYYEINLQMLISLKVYQEFRSKCTTIFQLVTLS